MGSHRLEDFPPLHSVETRDKHRPYDPFGLSFTSVFINAKCAYFTQKLNAVRHWDAEDRLDSTYRCRVRKILGDKFSLSRRSVPLL